LNKGDISKGVRENVRFKKQKKTDSGFFFPNLIMTSCQKNALMLL